MKRFFCALLATACLCGCLPAAASEDAFTGISPVRSYVQGTFSDVQPANWYASSVAEVYADGLMEGSDGLFRPNGTLSVAEALALVCRLQTALIGGTADFAETEPWYQSYVDYALESGILSYAYADYDAAVSRAEFAAFLSAALSDEAAAACNRVEATAVTDVPSGAGYAEAVCRLYRAGILSASGATVAFRPGDTLTRAEAAALLARAANPALRVSFSLIAAAEEGETLTASQIYAQCSPSVFSMTVYLEDGSASTGSGFFLGEDGLAVTNYHVISGAVSAEITTSDGQVCAVAGIYDYSEETDLALLQIEGSGFTPLALAEEAPAGGDTVYTLGAPLGLASTIADGIVSNPSREYDGVTYIQTTASISSGSSGGALINAYGQAVGITTASLVMASGVSQNVNLAIPVSQLETLSTDTLYTLPELVELTKAAETSTDPALYENSVTSYGSVTGEDCVHSWLADTQTELEGYVAGADRYEYPASVSNVAKYMRYLLEDGFEIVDSEITDNGTILYYQKQTEDGTLLVGVRTALDSSGIFIYLPESLPERVSE